MTQPNNQVDQNLVDQALDGDFSKLLDANFSEKKDLSGQVVKGIIVALEGDDAIVDIGMKSEGRISLKEFAYSDGDSVELNVGDKVDVFVESLDAKNGEAQLSREKARREEVLDDLQTKFDAGDKVQGIIFGKVKGGFAVDVTGVLAFLPGSQVDVRPIKDIDFLMHSPQDLKILKLDRKRGNIIVSRRAVLDEHRSADRDELLENMGEGQVLEGIVKNITDYGAFVDLGGVDGLLHITDIAWHRINHPSEVIKLGETIKVQIIRYDADNKRVSLGIKQMSNDPWQDVDASFPIGAKIKGAVTNITDYGAFVELAPGVEGLIHVSEMSWTRKNVHPGKILSSSEEVEVMVLEIDRDKRRISLGLKQCQENPWQAYANSNAIGDKVKGTVRSMTEFGIFVGLTDDIDGLIHVSDIAWNKSGEEAMAEFKKGQEVEAVIIALDPAKERVALSLKDLGDDSLSQFMNNHKRGDLVNATVTAVQDDGIEVDLAEGVISFVKTRDLALSREEQDTSRFNVGDKVDVKITQLTKKDRKLSVSIRAIEMAEERETIKAYSEQEDGGSALGDALSQVLSSDGDK